MGDADPGSEDADGGDVDVDVDVDVDGDGAAVVVFYNDACSKCRATVALLDERRVVHERVEYLEAPLDRATLTRLAEQLVDPVAALVRVDDPAFTVLGLDPADYVTAPAVIDLLVAHPEVMQRPVVVSGGRAVIARPPDRVGELIGRMPPD